MNALALKPALRAETFRMSLFDINCPIEFGSATAVVLIA
jgi:hypothetical protein